MKKYKCIGFICEKVDDNEYSEEFKNEKFLVQSTDKTESLTKYIELNQKNISRLNDYDRFDYFLKMQKENLEGITVLDKECSGFDSSKVPYVYIDMWKDYVEDSKDKLPDIPIINIKKLKKK